jgi:hypothetical protein
MSESIIVTLPKKMPLERRISEASKQITEWLQSFDKPFNCEKDRLHLTRCKHTDRGYSYRYSLVRRQGLSASDGVEGKGDPLHETFVISGAPPNSEIPETGV